MELQNNVKPSFQNRARAKLGAPDMGSQSLAYFLFIGEFIISQNSTKNKSFIQQINN
jgi:hypothetical protein